MKKVIIAGCRDFNDEEFIFTKLDELLGERGDIEIVEGEASGVDKIARKWAESKGIKVHSFPANWNMYGASAGPRRNSKMADFADELIAFWDMSSKGTYNIIKQMKGRNKKFEIVNIKLNKENNEMVN